MKTTSRHATGDSTGLLIPANGDALREGGAGFLTRAFRAFGTLGPDNHVTAIRRIERCPGGSTGDKFFLSVSYAHAEASLDEELFVKFSRDFTDPVRDDRGKYELEGEVRFAEISRSASFPVCVPRAFFADYEAETKTGLLITQRITFGTGGIERQHGKCMDHELVEPVRYYRVIVRALARVAAAQRSDRLGSEVAGRFPYDPQAAADALRVTADERALRLQIADNAAFVARNPQLYPAGLDYDRLFARLDASVARLCRAPGRVEAYLTHDLDMVALCHWNAHIDNCWFWSDDAGALHCGLMDWGHAGQLNLAFSLWGCLSGATWSLWNDHLDSLLDLFVTELAQNNGPVIAPPDLLQHLCLYVFLMYLSYFIQSPARMLQRVPDLEQASGSLDPMILGNETVRNQLLISTNVLNLMERWDLEQALDAGLGAVSHSN